MDAISIGAAAMVSAVERFDASATQTADGTSDLVQQVTSRMEAKTDFQTSAEVVKTTDRMMGSLIDIVA